MTVAGSLANLPFVGNLALLGMLQHVCFDWYIWLLLCVVYLAAVFALIHTTTVWTIGQCLALLPAAAT
jgi:hypothetical protein